MIREESLWCPELHRIDRQRLGLGGLGRGQSERFIVGVELETGRYRISDIQRGVINCTTNRLRDVV